MVGSKTQVKPRSRMFSTFAWYFLSPNGRISRQEFRLGFLGIVLVYILLVRYYVSPDVNPPYDGSVRLALLIVLWPLIAILAKRLHDLNVSGWWLLTLLAIPLVASAINISVSIPYLLIVAFLSFFPGGYGDNRFGRDPLARAGI
ncbi:DUF805 domain-containing protein [Bradyrhizobium sp. Leo170]|uniref:DUF805 domain-containing protein n=1 Tax=Bradyrhizobium sp. Leo170 TaxID=1571199 RepID=UPI00102EC382|nr:DUF805 domain-containing protein [Bradyrhizobium sp. Leo170]TAI66164.1 hypothetical protein CWO89_09680 [Bradyrhizobium sp. Leo170]